jgi:hypothetical protein
MILNAPSGQERTPLQSPPGAGRRLWWALGLSPLLLGALALFILPGPEEDLPASKERIARGRLVRIAQAQEQFRAGVGAASPTSSYWRADLAGLYVPSPSKPGSALLDLPLVLADDRPTGRPSLGPRAAVSGYWYRSLPFEGEGIPDPGHFAACAFPEKYPASGRFTLLVSDQGVVWMKDLGKGGGIPSFPRDPLKENWRRID